MLSARSYECPACGGLVREAARVCGYCRTPIATIRCGRCFTMNVPEAHHCMDCGAELGLQPITTDPGARADCPRCANQALDAFSSEDGTVFDCARCGGQFVAVEVLRAMLRRYENVALDSARRYRAANPISEPVKYLPCPFCSEQMLRKNFGRVSGVVVDVCAKHGTWFDIGELARILSFVADGGLQRAAALTSEEHERNHKTGTTAIHDRPVLQYADPSLTISLSDMRDSVVAFARWVSSQLK